MKFDVDAQLPVSLGLITHGELDCMLLVAFHANDAAASFA